MSITGVFFIPSNPNASTALATITERLHTSLADDPVPVGRWALEHKLMRDTPSCVPGSPAASKPRYMQFLSLSYHSNHGFIYTSVPESATPHQHQHQHSRSHSHSTTPPGTQTQTQPQPQTQTQTPAGPNASPSSMIMTTVPLPSSGTLFQHFTYAAQPLWSHRHSVTVPGGAVYDVGDFRVRVGDVRQTQPTGRVRGTVVEVEWRGPSIVRGVMGEMQSLRLSESENGNGFGRGEGEDEGDGDGDSAIEMLFAEGIEEADIDAEYVATTGLIREFWAKLGVEGAREAIMLPDVGKEVKGMLRKLKQRSGAGPGEKDEDPDPEGGVDVARQFMEIFRFNR